ncbi:septum formation family protein [Nocardioides sp. SYSU DS0651]|uniref:septum formation family protein n=1 Tax=Nocardioides sp. SYSU DS0651 TaxID=3415955 RepID=UPI003F4B34C4
MSEVTRRPRARALLAAGSFVVLASPLAACTGDGGAPRADPSPEPTASQTTAPEPPARPEVGACYDLPFEAAVAPTTEAPPVSCRQPHTTETVAVGTIDAVVDGHLLAIDSEHVQAQVASVCPRRLIRYLGGTPRNLRLSMIRPVWFTPTVEKSDEGADWFRCDAVVLSGSEQLAEMRGTLKGALRRAPRPQHAMCGTAAPDAKDFERVPCSERHSWRAIDVVTFDDGGYPGEKRVRAAGRRQCEDAGAEVAEDPLDFRWGYEWPTREQWEMGQKFGRCWAPES